MSRPCTVSNATLIRLIRAAGACEQVVSEIELLLKRKRTPGRAWRHLQTQLYRREWFVRALGLPATARQWPWSRVLPFVEATLRSSVTAVNLDGTRGAWSIVQMAHALPTVGNWFYVTLLPALRRVWP